MSTPTSTLTKTPIPPTITHTLIATMTLTPLPTLESKQAEEVVIPLLQKAETDCLAPCFWGIVPEKTTLEEVESVFAHLGFRSTSEPVENNRERHHYYHRYEFDSGIFINADIVFHNSIVEGVRVRISEKLVPAERKWLAYSPETLIRRYGTPSKAEFFVSMREAPFSLYSMILYFESVNLIVEYSYEKDSSDFIICPLKNQQNFRVSVWFGESPPFSPLPGVALSETSSMTLDEFSKLMTGEPDDACIDLKTYFQIVNEKLLYEERNAGGLRRSRRPFSEKYKLNNSP